MDSYKLAVRYTQKELLEKIAKIESDPANFKHVLPNGEMYWLKPGPQRRVRALAWAIRTQQEIAKSEVLE